MNQLLKKKYTVSGMHCASCEIIIEEKLNNIEGIEKVRVNFSKCVAEVHYTSEPDINQMKQAISADGYSISHLIEKPKIEKPYTEALIVLITVYFIYIVAKSLNILPDNLVVSDAMSYSFILLIGLTAGFSTCMAVTGGLLLAISEKFNSLHQNTSVLNRMRPYISFNAGRIISYTLFGGLLGALGSVFTLSPNANVAIIIIASLVMIILGFDMLKIFPCLKKFYPKMPRFISRRAHNLTQKEEKFGAFLVGATTFFLPCGFTQALQLYVLSKGDMLTGALTMLVFSLGTLPTLLSLGALSSFTKGRFHYFFLKVTGVVVILLGISNIQSALVLAGLSGNQIDTNITNEITQDPNVQYKNGKQIVKMQVKGYEYSPHRFTVQKGVPVEWQIDGRLAKGCAKIITMPKMRITERLNNGITTIMFTPTQTGTLNFSCTMGMTTPGSAFVVVDTNSSEENTNNTSCDPTTTNCVDNN